MWLQYDEQADKTFGHAIINIAYSAKLQLTKTMLHEALIGKCTDDKPL